MRVHLTCGKQYIKQPDHLTLHIAMTVVPFVWGLEMCHSHIVPPPRRLLEVHRQEALRQEALHLNLLIWVTLAFRIMRVITLSLQLAVKALFGLRVHNPLMIA
jgi:hypothetical protein